MANPKWIVKNLRWWNWPIRLYRKDGDSWEKVGWIWNQRAYIVNNIHHGWIAFIEDQTKEHLSYLDIWSCDCCNAEIWGAKKRQIEEFVRNESSKNSE